MGSTTESSQLSSEEEKIMKVIDIEGISTAYAAKLLKAGIRTVEGLLKDGASPKGRKEIAAASGIDQTLVLEWVNRADLYRIKGVGKQYSDLLEKAGVDTVVELSKRVAANLYTKMVEVNQAKNLVNGMPGVKKVEGWIAQAKKMPRVVTY
jgi:predicted flap endonuclease-1-like 5' DNA nuclease